MNREECCSIVFSKTRTLPKKNLFYFAAAFDDRLLAAAGITEKFSRVCRESFGNRMIYWNVERGLLMPQLAHSAAGDRCVLCDRYWIFLR